MNEFHQLVLLLLITTQFPTNYCHQIHQHRQADSLPHDEFEDHSHPHTDIMKCGFEEPSDDELLNIREIINAHRETKLQQHSKDSQITFDVYVHVIRKSDQTGNLQRSTVEKQIDILNGGFRGDIPLYSECQGQGQQFTYGGTYATPLRFKLREIIYHQDNDAFDLSGSDDLRRRERIGGCDVLNIYTGDYGDFLGKATSPQNCAGDTQGDSVIINYKSFPDLKMLPDYNQGDSLIHEVGHWLGLYHTFKGGCQDPNGDYITDTPFEDTPSSGCQIGRDTCVFDGEDPIHNFMDYSYDCCLYRFTQGQSEWMADMAEIYRISPSPTAEPTTSGIFASPDPPISPTPGSPSCRAINSYFRCDSDVTTSTAFCKAIQFFFDGKIFSQSNHN